MLSLPLLPLLADVGTFISALFLVIAFIGWLLNLFSGKNQPPPPPAPGPRARRQPPRDRKVQDEIEVFLREVGQSRQPNPREEEIALEIVDEPEIPLSARRQQREQAERAAASNPALSNELQQHLLDYMARDRVSQQVEQNLARDVSREVSQHLGSFVPASAEAGGTAPSSASQLVQLLRSPEGVRQAILVSEVLSPPLSQRKRN